MIPYNFARSRCLVLSRDVSLRSTLNAVLPNLGYTVDLETERKNAITKFLKNRHSLILLDAQYLPRQPARLILLFKMAHRNPAVVIFSKGEKNTIAYLYLKDGIFEMIQVPFKINQLVVTVKRAGDYLRMKSRALFLRDLMVHVGLAVPVVVLLTYLLARG